MVNRSPKPLVISNALDSPFLSSNALVATVVPMRTLSNKPIVQYLTFDGYIAVRLTNVGRRHRFRARVLFACSKLYDSSDALSGSDFVV